jgi:hypothetical protein
MTSFPRISIACFLASPSHRFRAIEHVGKSSADTFEKTVNLKKILLKILGAFRG